MKQPRLKKLYEQLKSAGLGGLAVNAGPTMTYLSGLHFHLMERPVVMVFTGESEPVIILPELEQRKLAQLEGELQVYTYGENPDRWQQVFNNALDGLELEGHEIAVEPGNMRLLEYNYLKNAAAADYVDGSAITAALRAVKEPSEVEDMREAVRIAEASLTATLPMVRAGVSEREIASELVLQLLRNGSESELPFSPIVASGPNGANPHSQPGQRKLEEGDLLIIDWGACWNGYASDLTRTFAVGTPDDESRRIYELVRNANRAGRLAGTPGVACSDVDIAARKVIEQGGYGEFFTHRTGHGIGMECHEQPYMHGENSSLLQEGMAYTVEPGIYLAGRNGVRIEDDVVVTADGSESLSSFSRELVVLG